MRKPLHSRALAAQRTAARLAILLGPLLLAAAVLSACRQDPNPQPLPDPITDRPEQSLAASAVFRPGVAFQTPLAADFMPSCYAA